MTLVLKTGPYDLSRPAPFGDRRRTNAVVRRLRRHRRRPARTAVITTDLSDTDVARLHARGDCYVSLTRGEGFGLGIVDAGLQGNPVITTGFGTPVEYLPADAAWLVNARLVAVEDDRGRPSFGRDQRWAAADPVHASALLRHVFEHRAEGARRGARLRESLRARFDPHALVPRFVDLVRGTATSSGG